MEVGGKGSTGVGQRSGFEGYRRIQNGIQWTTTEDDMALFNWRACIKQKEAKQPGDFQLRPKVQLQQQWVQIPNKQELHSAASRYRQPPQPTSLVVLIVLGFVDKLHVPFPLFHHFINCSVRTHLSLLLFQFLNLLNKFQDYLFNYNSLTSW